MVKVASPQKETGEPLTYEKGRMYWAVSFKEMKVVQAVRPLLQGRTDRAQDLGKYLYFVFGPQTIYKNMSQEDRLRMVLLERITDPQWLEIILPAQEVEELARVYQRLVLTPGQRLYFGLINNIDRTLTELSEAPANEDPQAALKRIENGEKLYTALKRVEAMIAEERTRKYKNGREPELFERPPGDT